MQRATLERLMAARQEGRVLVRALDIDTGEEILVDPKTDTTLLGLAAAGAVRDDTSQRVTLEGRSWFLTLYNTPWELVIVGAVHIAQALAVLATASGYQVRVIDPRGAYAVPERFPGIRLVQAWPDETLVAEPLTARSALVVLAHDTKIDDLALAAALRAGIPYIGALGSIRTHARRLERLAEMGFSVSELAQIQGPVGLNIGARSPGEIAISILAQLVQRRRALPRPPRIGGVVLAAGLSSRMGRNKLVRELDGKPLLRHAVETALASRLDPIVVVTGHEADAVKAALGGLDVLFSHNEAYAQGLSSSLQQGIAALPGDCDGAMILLGDMPGITPGLIDRLIAAFDPAAGKAICMPASNGRRGNPVLWGRQFFAEIEKLSGDAGARALMATHSGQIHEIKALDEAPFIDIDTQEALDAYSRDAVTKV